MKSSVFGIFGRAAGRSGYLARLFCLMSALALVAGCQDGRQNFLTTGIGSELSAPDLAKTETLQNNYFSYLCAQATWGSPKASATCVVKDWSLIAYQGMNDIDRRCDSYLQWLDNRKRSQKPWISQISDTAAATAAILPVVGAGTKAITIVAQAFNLVTKSVENYHSRLLLEVESSTVNTIVLQARYDFRGYLKEKKVTFNNKPEVEHVLRSYLRLCLPFAIEARINNYSTLGASGARPDAGNTLGDLPVVGVVNPNDPFGQTPSPRPPKPTTEKELLSVFDGEGYFDRDDLKKLQNVFCLQEHGVGNVGPKTKSSIKIFEEWQKGLSKEAHFGKVDGLIDRMEMGYIDSIPDCNYKEFRNFYERAEFSIAGTQDPDQLSITGILNRINDRLDGADVNAALPLSNVDVRAQIKRARDHFNLDDYGGFAGDHITAELYAKLTEPGN